MRKKQFCINRAVLFAVLLMILTLAGCGITSVSAHNAALKKRASSRTVQSSSSSSSSQDTDSSSQVSDSSAISEEASEPATPASAPSSQANTQTLAPAPKQQVTLVVDASKAGGQCDTMQVVYHSGDTVYNVLINACGHENINAKTSPYGVYIVGLYNHCEFDMGPQSGWIYCVNSTFPQQSCDKQKVNQGDTIKWLYTTDGGNSQRK